jgi:hypothetical protein
VKAAYNNLFVPHQLRNPALDLAYSAQPENRALQLHDVARIRAAARAPSWPSTPVTSACNGIDLTQLISSHEGGQARVEANAATA